MTEPANTVPQSCDLLITGAVVITLDSNNQVFGDGALAISGSEISAVGTRAELAPRYLPARHIDAGGGIVMPGLINTHNHTPLMIVRGMVEDLGFAPAYTPNIPQGHVLSEEETYLLARLGVYELLRFGSTTVVDYYRQPAACARAIAEFGLRGFVGGRIHDADTAALARGEWRYDRATGEASLEENLALIEAWDGAENGRIQCILAPHAGDTCSRELLRQVAGLAHAQNRTVHTHLCQSKSEITQVQARDQRSPVELLDEIGLLNNKLIAGHCIWTNDDEIGRIGRAGVNVAHAPIGNASSGAIAPTLALEQAGATMTLCTDTKSADMFESMRLAIALARIRGAGYQDINAARVLRWATANGAAALGCAQTLGALAPGFKADVLVLESGAPNLCPVIDGAGIVVHSGGGANVDTVIVDGRVVLEKRRPTLLDGFEVVASAQAVANRLWQKSGHRPVLMS